MLESAYGTAEAISVSAIELINAVFPRALFGLECTYVCCLDASSFCGFGFTVTSKSPGALDDEEDIVMKGCLKVVVGESLNEYVGKEIEKLKKENKKKKNCSVFVAQLVEALSRLPPSPCRFYF